VKGVLITGSTPTAGGGEALVPGMVIAEVQQEPVANAAELQTRIDKLKKDGKKAVVLLVVNPEGDPELRGAEFAVIFLSLPACGGGWSAKPTGWGTLH